MQLTATQAKSRFGDCLSQVKIDPICIEKNGRLESVIVSAAQPQMTAEEFGTSYPAWIAAQHRDFEKNGLWCDDIRTW